MRDLSCELLRISRGQWALCFLLAFLSYQLVLPLISLRPYPDFWAMQADSYRVSFQEFGKGHPMAKWQTSKHPLFVAIATPLYHGAHPAFRAFGEPLGENFALTFPVAILGGLNACIALALFSLIGFRGTAAVLTTVLYASSVSIWTFSSFPDSHICTTLFTNLFLFFYLKDPALNHAKRLAFWNALACFAAPQQILLAIIPTTSVIRERTSASPGRWLRYAVWFVALYLVPYLLFLVLIGSSRLPFQEARNWANWENLSDLRVWCSVATSFLALSVAVPPSPSALGSTTLAALAAQPAVWAFLAAILCYAGTGLFLGYCWREIRGLQGLVAYYVAYLLFFVCWDATHPFLFSAPILMPLWLLFHATWLERQKRGAWRMGLAVASALVIACSISFLWRCRDYSGQRVESERPAAYSWSRVTQPRPE